MDDGFCFGLFTALVVVVGDNGDGDFMATTLFVLRGCHGFDAGLVAVGGEVSAGGEVLDVSLVEAELGGGQSHRADRGD